MVEQNNLQLHSVDFGNTKQAGCVPEWLTPSSEPVYLEGRLVLSLSFQSCTNNNAVNTPSHESPLATYEIWDNVTERRYETSLFELHRFEDTDIVLKDSVAIWKGIVDTKRRIIKVPDLDAAGFFENQKSDLYWKMV